MLPFEASDLFFWASVQQTLDALEFPGSAMPSPVYVEDGLFCLPYIPGHQLLAPAII